MREKVELLAPAGNREGFYGAVHAGADAVYLAGRSFGARAYAENFSDEELLHCIHYAHVWGRKVYLTVNTLVKETEFEKLYEYLRKPYEQGLDGVIIQDIGVFSFIKQYFPELKLHASTQMTITGAPGARMLKRMGAARIVPARELSLAEIKKLKEESGLEVECFIHGAMCYSYSGQCLFSSLLGGRSGNRGRCAQPCRMMYQVRDDERTGSNCYPLSLKDLCTLEILPRLLDAGIDSLKIEGRMKSPEYTAGVTAIYRRRIDEYYSGSPQVPLKEDLRKLSTLYLRTGREDGYFFRHNGREMLTMSSPSYNGSDKEQIACIRKDYIDTMPKLSLEGKAVFKVGEPAGLILSWKNVRAEVSGHEVQAACKQPISPENIKKQISKLGDTCFCLDSLTTECDADGFYPLKDMNELRRAAIEKLESAIVRQNGFREQRELPDELCVKLTGTESKNPEDRSLGSKNPEEALQAGLRRGFCVSVKTLGQLEAVLEWRKFHKESVIGRIYIESDLFGENKELILKQCSMVKNVCECVIALPYILRAGDEEWLEQIYRDTLSAQDLFSGFLVRNLEALSFLQEKAYGGAIYTDAGLYLWNHYAIECIGNMIKGFCMPLELTATEKRKLLMYASRYSVEQIVYGRLPMMITANCVARSTSGCRKKSSRENTVLYLKDRMRKEFPVQLNCRNCMNIIYNSVPLSLHGERERLAKSSLLRLDFTVETERETRKILDFFETGRKGDAAPYTEYTTGHEKRGVE